MNQILCSNPRIIVNPSLPLLINKFRCYVLLGRTYHVYYFPQHPRDFDLRPFSPKRLGISMSDFDNCYVLDEKTGETYPMYLAVNCGHCPSCKVSKINSFVKRCEYESQMYNSNPWFGTLTYAPEYLPSDGVSVREAQLWLKRFRIDLVRAGYRNKIRYVLVGEYGKKTHRPHYHFLIWGIESFTHSDYLLIDEIFKKSWNKGFIQHRVVDMKDTKAFYYTSKYLKKDCFVPKGCNDTFILSSRKNGGIGAQFIDKHSNKIRKTLDCSYMFKNKFTSKIEKFCFCSYSINRIFPSFCRSVSSEFRSAIYDASLIIQNFDKFVTEFWRHYFFDVFEKIRSFVFIPYGFSHRPFDWLFDRAVSIDQSLIYNNTILSNYCLVDMVLCHCRNIIDKFINRLNLSLSKSLDSSRKYFLSKLFRYSKDVDISLRDYDCRNILSWESPLTCYV